MLNRWFATLVLLKAVDVAARGDVAPTVLLVGGAVALLVRPGRGSWALVLLAGAATVAQSPQELRREHLVLLTGVALAATAASNDGERLLLWRAQLGTLYTFAVLSKLNPAWLGGDALAGAGWVPVPPTPVLLTGALLTLVVEVTLAVAPWVPALRWPGVALAVLFHGAALVLLSVSPLVGLRLVVFGGTAVLLHAASAQAGAGPVPSRNLAASSDGL